MSLKSGLTAGMRAALGNTKQGSEIGIGGYRLFARVDDTTTYSSVVPVDVLEDGASVSDDILNNPISISVNGVVGDLVIGSHTDSPVVGRDFSLIGNITALLPAKSQQQIQRASQIDGDLRDAALLAERAQRLAGNAYGFFDNSASTAKSQQEKFIEYMETIHFSRLPVKLSTKYRDYDNMALTDLTTTCDNQTNDVTFSATFTEILYSQIAYVEISEGYSSPAKSVIGKVSENSDKGGQKPEELESSVISSIFR